MTYSSATGYARTVTRSTDLGVKPGRLPYLTIELTERCNNSCQHCFINRPAADGAAQAAEMDTDFVKKILLQAAELGCLAVRFTGGEPLLRADFIELYRFARRSGFKVTLFTNARLITPELAALLAALPPGKPVEITVYGMSAQSYEAVTGVPGSFAQFRRGIRLLHENRIPFVLKMAVLPANRNDVPAYERWLKEISHGEMQPVYILNLHQRARPDNPAKNLRIRRLRLSSDEAVNILSQAAGYEKEFLEFCSKFSGPQGGQLFTCGFGQSLYVDAYGCVQGCSSMRHPEMVYHLTQGTLEEALTRFFPQFYTLRAQNPDYLKRCAKCVLRGFCEQCPAQSWLEYGALDTPVEFLCRIAHAHARKLNLLTADEWAWEITDWQERLKRAGCAGEVPGS